MKKFIALIFLTLIELNITACLETSLEPEENKEIFGIWVEKNRDSTLTLEREAELDKDKYGFIIEPSGKFTERKNSGWCGTPPITYANFDGNWEYSIDSLLNIEVEYWGGMTNYKMEILSIKDDELVVKFIYNN